MLLPKQSSEFASRMFPDRKRATGGATPKTYFTLSIVPLKCTTSAAGGGGGFWATTGNPRHNSNGQRLATRTRASCTGISGGDHLLAHLTLLPLSRQRT